MWEVGRILISFFSPFLVTVRSNDDIETAAIGRSYSRESAQHMQGIQQIVDLRGRLHKLEDSFQLKVLLVDIYVVVITNGSPLFHASRLATPRPAPQPILRLGELSNVDSPRY
ncbi:hypothetical protein V8E51_010879 [Hyaloscypha variabilis]